MQTSCDSRETITKIAYGKLPNNLARSGFPLKWRVILKQFKLNRVEFKMIAYRSSSNSESRVTIFQKFSLNFYCATSERTIDKSSRSSRTSTLIACLNNNIVKLGKNGVDHPGFLRGSDTTQQHVVTRTHRRDRVTHFS